MTHWGTHRDAAPPAVRRAVLKRDGHQCTATSEGQRCTERATDVHHVDAHADGGHDTETNLISLCAWHHRKITGRQGAAGRSRRPPKKHPGTI